MKKASFNPAKKIRLLRFLHAYSHYDRGDRGRAAPEYDPSTLGEAPQVFSDLVNLIKTLDEGHIIKVSE